MLASLIYTEDSDTLADACWAISYLSDGPNSRIQSVIEAGVSRRLVELLMHDKVNVVSAALRAVGNIVTGDDVQTQVCLRILLSLKMSINPLMQGTLLNSYFIMEQFILSEWC